MSFNFIIIFLKLGSMLPTIFLTSIFPFICSITISGNSIIIYASVKKFHIILNFLKLSSLTSYKQLLDMYALDKVYPQHKRFELHYMLLSQKNLSRIILKYKIGLHKNIAKTNSSVKMYPSAGFLEREIWDFFGIFFSQHPDLRRLLTDYGFAGFPLRKDFPVTGFKEIRYDDEKGRIISENVKYTQAYRQYTFDAPWILKKKS